MRYFDYDPTFLSLDDTLGSGQVFRWQRRPDGSWTGVLRGQLFVLRREGSRFYYESYPEKGGELELLRDLLLLDVDLNEVQRELVERDPGMAGPISCATGLRLLRQDPEECLVSFVCSTANNVPRIAHGIKHLSRLLGEPIATLDGQLYSSFPALEVLAGADAAEIQRETGLGYRAASLVRVAQQLLSHEPGWMMSLRQRPYAEAHAELVEFRGVGPKIADCVCLFSLDHTEAVPVDTHIWQVAQELWYSEKVADELAAAELAAAPAQNGKASVAAKKGLTSSGYKRVGEEFRQRYGKLAGYAQAWLFYAHFCGYWGGASPLLKG